MKSDSPENPIDRIETIISNLIDFSNVNKFDFNFYKSFADESSTSFNRYFLAIEDRTIKEKIISDLTTDFHFQIDDIVSNMLSIKSKNGSVSDGTIFIAPLISDNRIRGFENNYKQLIELFLNRVNFNLIEQPQQHKPPIEPAAENEQTKMYFKVGLLFAKKEIYKNVVKIDGFNKVTYHFKDEVFDNPSQLSRHLLLTRQFINDSFTGAKTRHNIFNNLKQLKNIIDYCNKNKIIIDDEFLNKYTTLVESTQ